MTFLPILGVAQSRIFTCPKRFINVVAGRRFGKSKVIAMRQFRKAYIKPKQETRYVAPSYKMARRDFWEPLKAMIDPGYILKKNESDLAITLLNKSRIMLLGADNPDSLRGPGLDLADFDEYADIEARTWSEVIRPALAAQDPPGEAGFFGTPKGYNHFYDSYLLGESNPEEWASFTFTTAQGGRVLRSEINAARNDLDPRVFRQEFEASFENLTGRMYANFLRKPWPVGNMDATIIDLGRPLVIGLDFNINPMSAVVIQEVLGWPQVLDNIALPTSNTEELCIELRKRYPDRHLSICPDASGNYAKGTNSPLGQTDFTILAKYGFKIISDKVNPGIHDRVNNVQSLLCSATQRRRLTIHPRCNHVIKSLEGQTWKEGTSTPEKKGLDHMADALGYAMWQKWNLLGNIIPDAVPQGGDLYSPYNNE